MNKSFDLLSLGEVLLRLSPPGNERLVRGGTLQEQVGGAELNVVSGVSLLGLRTGIISKLPANDIGTYAKNQIRFCGVSDDYLVYDSSPDARLGIYFYENGAYPRKPGVVYDRKHSTINNISIDDFDDSLFTSTRCFHTSGITLALSPQCCMTGMEMIRRFKENGAVISFDVNFRGNLWSGDQARECIKKILPYVDIFFAYVSGVLYGLLSDYNDCQRALEIGNATSAVKNTIPGDLPSSDLKEIENLIRSHKSTGPQPEMAR